MQSKVTFIFIIWDGSLTSLKRKINEKAPDLRGLLREREREKVIFSRFIQKSQRPSLAKEAPLPCFLRC